MALLAAACGDAPADDTPTLDLDASEADTEFGTLHVQRVAGSFVGALGDGQAIGVAPLDDADRADGAQQVVAYVYDRDDVAIMTGTLDADGTASLDSADGSDFPATVEVRVDSDAAAGTVTLPAPTRSPSPPPPPPASPARPGPRHRRASRHQRRLGRAARGLPMGLRVPPTRHQPLL